VYRISNISAVVELSRVEVGGRVRARWPKTRGGRKLGGLAYGWHHMAFELAVAWRANS
jgi:hypothetical protein